MQLKTVFESFRGWSWILGGLSLVPVLFCGYHYVQFSLWASEQSKNGEFVCGTGIVAVLFLCAAAALFLAVCAVACSSIAYVKAPKPRSLKRTLELPLLGAVLILVLLFSFFALIFKWSF